MAFGRLTSPSAVNANDWACTINFSVFRHCLALLVVLVFGMSTSTDWAYYHVLGTRASQRFVTEHPASFTLGDEGVSLILPWTCGAVSEQEWRVMHDVLKMCTIGVKESNGN